MACFTPLKAYRGAGGRIAFSSAGRAGGWCDRPIELPCGQCQGCRLERSRQWAVRCYHEGLMHKQNCFVTLTYNDQELPEGATLVKSDFQKFVKRLRKKRDFRYFHCGEYGEEDGRPHYHGILFGIDFRNDQVLVKERKGTKLYTSKSLEKTWGHGYVTVGEATWQSAAYVARYIMKKVTGEKADEWYEGRQPEYVTMSRRPGIGATWFQRYSSDIYPSDEVVVNGQRMRPPTYYDSLIPSEELQEFKRRRRIAVAKRAEDLAPERLKAREKNMESRMKRLRRTL